MPERRPVRRSERALSLAPLALAIAALAVRETTREVPAAPLAGARASEFIPPPMLVSAISTSVRYEIVPEASFAIFGDADASRDAVEGRWLARGSLHLLADESIAELRATLSAPSAERTSATEDDEISLSAVQAGARPTCVPGVRAGTLTVTWPARSGARQARLEGTWMRFPGGGLRFQGVGEIEPENAAPAAAGSTWTSAWKGEPRRTLALELALRETP